MQIKSGVTGCVAVAILFMFSCAKAQECTDNRKMVVDKQTEQISIYMPVGTANAGRYLQVNVQHFKNKAKMTDLWRLTRCYDVNREGDFAFENNRSKEIIYPGEWDCAIMTTRDGKRNPDFMGGFHGYEELTDVELTVDGQQIALSERTQTEAQEVVFAQRSYMYEHGSDRKVALHTKRYTITSGVVNLSQSVEWLVDIDVANAYLSMLPISRSLDDGTQITDRLTIDDNPKVYDVSKSDSGLSVAGTNVRKVSIWGEQSGVRADVEVMYEPLLPGNYFFCSMYTPQTGYNKLYFDFCRSHSVTNGEVWNAKTTFKLTINR